MIYLVDVETSAEIIAQKVEGRDEERGNFLGGTIEGRREYGTAGVSGDDILITENFF